MTQGVIYVATGEKYIAEALASAASLKARSPALPVCFFTDQALTSSLVDQIIPLEQAKYHPTLKPRCLAASPFDRTLFLDTDTYVCADLSGMFALLDRFDLAAVHDNHAFQGSALRHLADVMTSVPEAFVQFNGGVILFRRSPAMTELFKRWIQLIERNERLAAERGGKHQRDQTALREAIYESSLQVATLPREYNCRYHFVGALNSDPKILHGRKGDFASVAGQLNCGAQPRVFMNYAKGMRVVTRREVEKSYGKQSLFQRAVTSFRKRRMTALTATAWRRLSMATVKRRDTAAPPALNSGGDEVDVFVISFPKCGRTWLRVLLGDALQRQFRSPDLNYWKRDFGGDAPGLPRLSFHHDGGPLTKTATELSTDKTPYAGKKVILLVRDPRDALVSIYFQASQRKYDEEPERRFGGTLHEYLHQPVGSVDTFLRYYTVWAEQRHVPRDFLLMRYEDIYVDPAKELRRALDFIGVSGVSDRVIADAVAFASFDNMHRMEAENKIVSGKLRAKDFSNPESFKTRRGLVGGYVDYLSAGDTVYLNERIRAEFPAYYGYAV